MNQGKRNALTIMCVPKPVRDDPNEVEVPLRPTSDAWRVERCQFVAIRACVQGCRLICSGRRGVVNPLLESKV